MKRQNRSRPESREEGREYRSGAMARSRSTEPRTYQMRRRSRSQPVMAEPVSALRHFWDEHAIKAGMAAFWGWYIVANWNKFPQVFAPLMG